MIAIIRTKENSLYYNLGHCCISQLLLFLEWYWIWIIAGSKYIYLDYKYAILFSLPRIVMMLLRTRSVMEVLKWVWRLWESRWEKKTDWNEILARESYCFYINHLAWFHPLRWPWIYSTRRRSSSITCGPPCPIVPASIVETVVPGGAFAQMGCYCLQIGCYSIYGRYYFSLCLSYLCAVQWPLYNNIAVAFKFFMVFVVGNTDL